MVSLRAEKPADILAIREVNAAAFGRSGEGELVDRLRKKGALTISLVAEEEGKIIGHIAFNPANVKCGASSFQALALAPLAVLPAYQNKGVGAQLVKAGLEACRRIGQMIVVLVGHPEYYPRFGFVRANVKGLECEFEAPDEAWMVAELEPNALGGRQGKVEFQPEFRDYI